ncbi:MAG TPA: hypothetical protein VHA37_03200 [Candidatus Saccharimonadales bacterium]|nr:hypothetical protein [Candidatus Saccharimonadales bacterium]
MSKTKFAIAALPALLLSSAAVAADLGQPAAPDLQRAFSLGVGVVGFDLPDRTDGIGGSDPGTAVGVSLSGAASFGIGHTDDYDVLLGINAFWDMGGGGSTSTQTFSGPGVVVVPGYTTPAGTTIQLGLAKDAGASTVTPSVTDTNHNPQGSNAVLITPLVTPADIGGTANGFGVTPSGDGSSFVFGGLTGDGPNQKGLVFGSAAATDGGVFIAAGDLDGLSITTNSSQSISYGGADITLALAKANDGTTSFQGYVGPSYRHLGQHDDTKVSVNIPELDVGSTFPTYSMDSVTDLNSDYFGGLVGATVTQQLSDKVALTLGGEGALYFNHTSISGTQSYTVSGGNQANNGGPVPSQTVTNATGPSGDSNSTAFGVRGQAGMTVALAHGLSLGLNGNVDYLSSVPTVSQGSATVTSGSMTDAGGSVSYTGAAQPGISLSYGGMLVFGATASLTGHF